MYAQLIKITNYMNFNLPGQGTNQQEQQQGNTVESQVDERTTIGIGEALVYELQDIAADARNTIRVGREAWEDVKNGEGYQQWQENMQRISNSALDKLQNIFIGGTIIWAGALGFTDMKPSELNSHLVNGAKNTLQQLATSTTPTLENVTLAYPSQLSDSELVSIMHAFALGKESQEDYNNLYAYRLNNPNSSTNINAYVPGLNMNGAGDTTINVTDINSALGNSVHNLGENFEKQERK